MQNRIADIDKRQLKKAPTANDIAWSLRKREILAMNKVRFATTQTGYHNIKRKHLIGFDRLASRLPSRGIGAQQNENDLINRVLFYTMSQKQLVTGNKRELRQELNIPSSFAQSPVNENLVVEPGAYQADQSEDYPAVEPVMLDMDTEESRESEIKMADLAPITEAEAAPLQQAEVRLSTSELKEQIKSEWESQNPSGRMSNRGTKKVLVKKWDGRWYKNDLEGLEQQLQQLIDRKPKSSPDGIRKYIKNVSTSGGKLQAVVQATYSTSDSGQKQKARPQSPFMPSPKTSTRKTNPFLSS